MMRGLIVVPHPAVEGDAVIGALAARHDDGVPWHQMAVIAPPGAARLAAVARSARRSAVPVQGEPGPRLEGGFVDDVIERVVQRVVESDGQPDRLTVYERCTQVFASMNVDLFGGGIASDLAQAMLRLAVEFLYDVDGFVAAVRAHPYVWRPPASAHTDAVRLADWNGARLLPPDISLIVIVGMVDGIWPRAGKVPADAERFAAIIETHPSASVIAIAAPEASQLVSRLVEQWSRQPLQRARRTPDQSRFPLGLSPTAPTQALWPQPSLRLSATQLTTYENCPWSHALQYGATVRSESGLSARFGTLVHAILEKFLVAGSSERSHDSSVEPTEFLVAGSSERSHDSSVEPTEFLVAGSSERSHDSSVKPTEFLGPPHHDGDHIGDRLSERPTLTRERLFEIAEQMWDPSIAQYRPQREDYRSRLDTLLDQWWEDDGSVLAARGQKVLFTERRFEIPVGPHVLTGSIDRIDAAEPGTDPPGLAIIDYKTGATATHAAAEESIQLSTYHLAASTDPELVAHGEVRSLELHFLQSEAQGAVRKQHITDDHAERTVRRVMSLAEQILAEQTSPSSAADCQYCDLQRLCPRQAPGRPLPIAIGRPPSSKPTNNGRP
jgi:RecB family exonuclease